MYFNNLFPQTEQGFNNLPKKISESVSSAPMNKNAHILIQEAQLKRPQIITSPERASMTSAVESSEASSPYSIKGSISADSIFSHALDCSEEHLSKLHSVSELSEKILAASNGNSPVTEVPQIRLIFADEDDTESTYNYLVKPRVKLSRQVEHFGKLIHERNAQFVEYCRKKRGTLKFQESFYFDDEEVLHLEKHSAKVSDVDLPVVEEKSESISTSSTVTLEYEHTNPNVDVDHVDNNSKTAKNIQRTKSMEEHTRWNKFLKDLSQMTIEIDDDTEEYL